MNSENKNLEKNIGEAVSPSVSGLSHPRQDEMTFSNMAQNNHSTDLNI